MRRPSKGSHGCVEKNRQQGSKFFGGVRLIERERETCRAMLMTAREQRPEIFPSPSRIMRGCALPYPGCFQSTAAWPFLLISDRSSRIKTVQVHVFIWCRFNRPGARDRLLLYNHAGSNVFSLFFSAHTPCRNAESTQPQPRVPLKNKSPILRYFSNKWCKCKNVSCNCETART